PIRDVTTLFNVQAPGIITNTLTLGASYDLTEDITFSLAWMHGFRDSVQGPILQLPHSSVRLDAQVDTLWAGFNVKFGGSKRKGPVSSAPTGGDFTPSPTWESPHDAALPGSSGIDLARPPVPRDPSIPTQGAGPGSGLAGVASPRETAGPQSP